MEKNDGAEKKLLRPTAALRSKSSSSTASVSRAECNRSSTETNKSAGAENGSSPSITEDFMKKISSNVMSPLTANRPGRLASFRPERDLTLGTISKSLKPATPLAATATGATGAKAKKVFAPTIPTRRGKNQEAEKFEEKAPNERPNSHRGRKDDSGQGRGRGRNRPELIQTTGSVFGEGITTEGRKRASSSWGRDSSSNEVAKPTLNLKNLSKKIDKNEEDAKLKQLLQDDFLDDDQLFDHSLSSIPILLPKTNTSLFLKDESEVQDAPKPSLGPQYVGDVPIKQEKLDEPLPTAPSLKVEKLCQRRKTPSQIQPADVFKNDGELIFFQLPDMLPSLKTDKSREKPEIKTEPGKTKSAQPAEETQPVDGDKTQNKEGTLSSLPEGRLGTLRIHQSGKVTMQLGDHTFVIDGGTQVSFLQDLISTQVNPETKTGTMTALGSIRYKAVCLPSWEDLIEDT